MMKNNKILNIMLMVLLIIKMKLYLVLLLLLSNVQIKASAIPSFHQYHHLPNGFINDSREDLFNIIISIFDFFDKVSNVTFTERPECTNQFLNDLISNGSALSDYFFFSGKGISDFGKEKECDQSSYEFNLIIYKIKNETLITFNDQEVVNFINQQDFFTGLCFPKNCSLWIDEFFNKTLNPYFFETYLSSNESSVLAIKNIYLTKNKSIDICLIILWLCFIISLSIQIILSLIKEIIKGVETMNKKGKKKQIEKKNYSEDSAVQDKSEVVIFTQLSRSLIQLNKSLTCKDYFKNSYENFNILSNLNLLFAKKSNCFDGFDLELFSFIQSILMFLMILNQNIAFIITIPVRDYSGQDFYQSFYFIFIILSSYAFNSWIVLDGMIMMYKFMWYLKTHVLEKDRSISIKDIAKFYFLALSKILLVIFMFLMFHYYSDSFAYFTSRGGSLYSYYKEMVYKPIDFSQIVYLFIPFYSLFQFDEISEVYEKYAYITTSVNEFYSFTLILILFYIGIKIKAKIYDIIILCIVIINIIISFLTLQKEPINNDTQLRLKHLIFQNYTGKHFHLTFNFYFLGAIGGMFLFYYKDVVNKKSISELTVLYLPYHYSYWIIQQLFLFKPCTKIALFIIVLVFKVIICAMFTIVVNFNSSITIDINFPVKFFYFILPIAFSVLFLFMIILIKLISSNQGFWHNLINFNIFRVLFRIKLAFFSSFDIMLLSYYCRFEFQLKLSYENMILISLGLFIFCMFYVICFTLAFELPIRLLTKYIINDNKQMIETNLSPIDT